MPDFSVSISDECHACLAQLAKQEGVSIPSLVNKALEGYCNQGLAQPGPTRGVADAVTTPVVPAVESEQRHAEESLLAHSRAFLQSTLDALSVHIAILNENGVILAVNAAWRHGAENHAFLGAAHGLDANYLAICDRAADDVAAEARQLAAGIRDVMARHCDEFVLEYPCQRLDQQQWFLARVTCFESPAGLRVVVAHENLTEHKQVEHHLHDSEERFRDLIEGSVQGILIVQHDEAVFVNQAYAELHGYDSPVDIYQLPCPFDLIAPHDRERLHQYRAGRFAGEDVPTHYDFQAVKRDGTLIWLEAVARLVTWRDAPAIQLAVIDKTSSKEAEQALQRADRLAMLGRMAATFSHEVRNPLQALRLYAQILEEEVGACIPDTAAASREHIDYALTVIREEATRMSDIVQDYLSLARLGSLVRDPEAFGVFVLGVLGEQRDALRRRDITLQLDGVDGLGYALLHPSTFRRALLNLLQNAMDAIGANGRLTLRGCETEHQLQLDIIDTGPGIAPELIPEIFTPFHTTKAEGTGLGLYVVQEVIAAHEGHIAVDSEVGEGTTFTITLPRAPVEAATLV
jgi:PAS domain S-box-containing protein